MLSSTYTCDQSAAVRLDCVVTIAPSVHGRRRTRAKSLKLAPSESHAEPGKTEPAIVLRMPAAAVKALNAGHRTTATVKFTVQNANGSGVATFSFVLIPLPGAKHGGG